MTVAQYEDFCQQFFDQEPFNSVENITNHAKSMSLDDFNRWFIEVCQKYNQEKYGFVRFLVAQIRGDYDPLNDYQTKEDPLKEENNQKLFQSYKEVFEQVFDKNFQNLEVIQTLLGQWREHVLVQAQEQAKNVEVEGQQFKAIAMCDVLWAGWECDDKVWIVQHEGQNKLIASNHGSTYFAQKQFLEDKIKEYEQAIEQSRKLLAMLN